VARGDSVSTDESIGHIAVGSEPNEGGSVAKKPKRIDIVKRDDHWVGERQGSNRVYVRGSTKDVAVRRAAKKAKRDPRAVSVRIPGRDGRIQEERSYPRSADPRSNKG
jgi:hypothetical protein